MDITELLQMNMVDILRWLTGAGAGVIAFFLIDRIELSSAAWLAGIREWFKKLEPAAKRAIAFAMAGLIAVLSHMILLMLQTGVEKAAEVIVTAIAMSQGAHGIRLFIDKRKDTTESVDSDLPDQS